ncbi:hypothetical protein ILUMI_24337 [Ignelater luminosus]|uniref:Uncharacterized protein n=1 Tax=Ignelater luminosus TaxID=2038154 RepID=A0A8K0G0R6_IGNLU|nr:hypothetical protein ILUMI_24337 [Ignelater luminosus]
MGQTHLMFVFFAVFMRSQFCTAQDKEPFNFNFFQNDYHIDTERIELVRYDKNYLKRYEFRTFKYNRTCTAFNITFCYVMDHFDMKKLEIVAQAYKFASNEYRLFPARFGFNFCDAIQKNMFGMEDFRNCGNFTRCSVEKGKTYHVCNWKINESKFPPLIPTGRYMIEFTHSYLSHEVVVIRGYGGVVRPFA